MNIVCRGLALVSVLACLVTAQPAISARGECSKIALSREKTIDTKNLTGTWRVDRMTCCDEETGEFMNLLGPLKHILVITADNRMTIQVESVKFFEWTVEYDLSKTPIW